MTNNQSLKKRLLALLLSLCIVCGMLPAMALTASAQEVTSGTGSAENPLPIRTADELAQVGQLIGNGSIWSILNVPENSIIHYRLDADISLSAYVSGAGWTPIGNETYPFTGVFDGNGHAITGLAVSIDTGNAQDVEEYPGLFGVVSGTVTGVTVDVSTYSRGVGTVRAGGIAGGVIENCFVSGRMESKATGGDGGIVGFLDGGMVKSCIVTASMIDNGLSGGVCGFAAQQTSSGSISGCAVLSKQIDGYVINREGFTTNITKDGCFAWNGVGLLYGNSGFQGIPTKSVGELQTAAAWPEAFKAAPWQYEEGKMPSLARGIQPLPTYILGGFDGNGSVSDPYLISDPEGLALFSRMSRNNSLAGVCFQLKADIDMKRYADMAAEDPDFDPNYDAAKGWLPIRTFRGNFDGSGFAIRNLFIDRPEEDSVGFFGDIKGNGDVYKATTLTIGSEGIIQKLGMEDADVTGKAETGAIAGRMTYGKLWNCYSTGKVSGGGKYQSTHMVEDLAMDDVFQFMSAGGVVGEALGSAITGCYSTAAVNGVFAVGGLAGFFWGTMSDCYTTGSVTSKYGDGVGGVLGMDHSDGSSISRCYSTATVEAGPLFRKRIDTWTGTGGVIGFGVGYLTDLYALNDRVDNNLPSELTTPDTFSSWVCYKVVGVSVQVENSSQKSWTGMELRGETKWRTRYDNNAAYFKTAGAWSSFNYLDAWTIEDGMLPILKHTGGPQSGKPPLWFEDELMDGYATKPALKDGARYEIWKASELAWCGLYPGELNNKTLDIKADIDLSAYSLGAGWLPVGMEVSDTITGLRVLGNGHTITGMTVNRTHIPTISDGTVHPSNNANYGLFGRLINAEISDLHIRDAKFTGGNAMHIGALVAYGENLTIRNCSAQSVVEEHGRYLGGLVGRVIDSCTFHKVSADFTCNYRNENSSTVPTGSIGGILGFWDRVSSCTLSVSDVFSKVRVFRENSKSELGCVGGIIGYMDIPYPDNEVTALLTDCYSDIEVSGGSADSETVVGGLIGDMQYITLTNKSYRLSNCYVTGSLSGTWAGGAIGHVVLGSGGHNTDKTIQFQLDNVLLLLNKIEGTDTVGAVCGKNDTVASDGHLIVHFRSVTDGDKNKRFTQKLDRWDGTKYILDGAEATTNNQLDDFLFIPYFGSVDADRIAGAYFYDTKDSPWYKNPWSMKGSGYLPTLSTLQGGHIRQLGAIPLYILLKCTWAMPIAIEVFSREDLNLLSAYINAGGSNERLNILLAQSIDMGDAPFTPMGTEEHPFDGTFDGQGYSIRGLRVDTTAAGGPAGLFGAASDSSTIQNLALIDPDVQGGDGVGALAGMTAGNVRRCYAAASSVYPWSFSAGSAQVRGNSNVGGLIGQLSGENNASAVEDCYTAVNVLAMKDNAGGLVGGVDLTAAGVDKTISRCYTIGRVTSQGRYAGGIYGRSLTGERLRLQVLLVMSPSIMNSAADNNCAIGGDTTASYVEENAAQTFIWEGLNATWNRTNPELNPPLRMNMSEEDGYANLCWANTWTTFMQFDPQKTGDVWLTADGVSAALKGFHNEQQSFVLENLTAGNPTLRQDGEYYLIRSARDWEIMGQMVNEQPQTYAGAKFRLEADIAFGDDLVYMGSYVPVGRTVPFTGELYGNGHTITFDPAAFAAGDIGLFGILGGGAYIHDLTVNASVENRSKSTQNTAAVAAVAQKGSKLQNITVTGSVTDAAGAIPSGGVYRQTGGIAGQAEGEIVSCQNRAEVSGGYHTGGIAGRGAGTLTSCVNEGAVSSAEGERVGGIVGFLRAGGTASLCVNRGGVSGKTAGGIAGRVESASVDCSFSAGPVYGTTWAGGIVGYLTQGTLQDVYASGSVSGRTAGGLAGLMDSGTLRRGYAIGEVKGSLYAGGVAGHAFPESVLEQTAALNTGIGKNGNRIVGRLEGDADYSRNNYGLDTLTSSQSGASYTGQDVARETLYTASFWTESLGLSTDLWAHPAAGTQPEDFFLPTLKGLGDQAAFMPPHLKLYAREGNTSLELKADKTELWSPKGQTETVVFTAHITGTTQMVVEWSCSDTSLTAKGNADKDGNPTCTLTIPAGYSKTITVTATLSDNSAITDSADVVVKARTDAQPPVIDTQPQDTATVVGKPAVLTVEAQSRDDGALSYQWYKTDVPDKDGTAIEDATAAAYEAPAETTGITYYYCVVTDTIPDGEGVGNTTASVKSDAAKVTVTKDEPEALTIVGRSRIVTYGDADFILQTSGGSGTGKVTWESDHPDVVSVDGTGKIAILKASDTPVTITATKAEDHQYKASSAQITVTVNKKTLTVTADDKSREYEQPNPALTYKITGFVNGEDASVLTKQPTASCTVGADAAVGTHPITVSGGEAENYEFVYVSGTLTVTKIGQATLSILQGSQIDKTYGNGAFTLSVTGGSGNGKVSWQSSDISIASVDHEGNVTIHKSGLVTITATKEADGPYVTANASTTVTVNKAVLTVTAKDAEKHFGEENPGLAYEITGFVNGEDETVLTRQPAIAVDSEFPEKELPVGSYVIKVGGGEAENYTFAYNNATLIVNKAAQSTFQIEGGNPVKTYGDAPFILTTRNGAGGAVTWQSGDETVATVVEDTGEVTIIGAGKVQITAISADTSDFSEALAAVTLTVEKAKLSITADPQTRVYGEENPAFTYGIEGFVNSDGKADLDELPVLTADADKKTGVGSYAIRLAGGEDDNYAYILNNAELSITPRPVTIQADDKETSEGGGLPELTWTVTEGNILDGDRLEGSLKAEATGVGRYPITEDIPFANPNYAVTFLPGTLTVLEKPKDPSVPMPSEPTQPDVPHTGDDFPAWTLLLLLLSMGAAIITNRSRRHRKES